jgi:hypothetical protein
VEGTARRHHRPPRRIRRSAGEHPGRLPLRPVRSTPISSSSTCRKAPMASWWSRTMRT